MDEAAETLAPSSERKATPEADDDMFVLAPKRGPKPRRTPRIPGSRDDQAEGKRPPAKPDKPVTSPPLALVPLTKPSADKIKPSVDEPEQNADLSPAAPADNPFRRDPIPDVKLKLRELELRKDEPEPEDEPEFEPEPERRDSALKVPEPPCEPAPAPQHLDEEPEAESEPEATEADRPAPASDVVNDDPDVANDDTEPPEPSYEGIGDRAQPSADPSALLPITSSLIKPRPVRRSPFLPAPAEPDDALEEPVFADDDRPAGDLAASVEPVPEVPLQEDPVLVDPAPVEPAPAAPIPVAAMLADPIDVEAPVEPAADLPEDDPLEVPKADPIIRDQDLPAPETGDPTPARGERRKRSKHRQTAAFEAPETQQEIRHDADQVKDAVSPRFGWLEDFLTDLNPSGVAVAGLVAISMILLIAASSLNTPAPPISRSLTLSIPEQPASAEPAEETAVAGTETPSGPLGGIVSYVGERFVSPAGPATTSPVLAKLETLEGAGQFARAAELAGLQRLLQPGQDYTIFAPNDDAFAKLGPAEIERLLQPEGRERLLALISHHVLPGRLTFDDIAGNTRAYTSLSGQPVPIDTEDGIRIGEAALIDADFVSDEGVIHMIDSLLTPPSP